MACLDDRRQNSSSSLIPPSEESLSQTAPVSPYSDEYIHTICENAMPLVTHHQCSGLHHEIYFASLAASFSDDVGSSYLFPLPVITAPPLQLLSAVAAGAEETEYSVASNGALNDNDPAIKVRKNKIILGEPTLTFQCNGKNYIRLSDPMLEQDLQTIYAPEYRGFFDGFGEKVTYMIAFHSRPKFVSKQRCCRQTYQGVKLYFTRERIAREVAQVAREFLKIHPDFYTDGAFRDWPVGSTIDGTALFGLRKVSRASIQIFFRYYPSLPSHI